MIYPALGGRTDFSLGESILSVNDYAEIAERLETDVIGIADTMCVSALVDATKTLEKAGKRLLIGARIRVVVNAERSKEEKPTYIKLWPTSEQGLRSLYQLITRGFDEDRFYYVARVTWQDLREMVDTEHLVLTTGDLDSSLQTAASFGELVKLVKLRTFAAVFYELVPSNTPYFTRQNGRAIAFGLATGVAPVVIQPMLWEGDNALTYSTNASIAQSLNFSDYLRPASTFVPTPVTELVARSVAVADAMTPRYPKMLQEAPVIPQGAASARATFREGLLNTARLVELCAYKWEKQPPSLPIVAADPDAEMLLQCKAGIKTRFVDSNVFGHKPTPAEIAADYIPRLQFELETLKRLGFAQYFLLVADLVRWSKAQGIFVGPGRGSVGGSLVAYLMGITDVDPIRFGLLFERFINPDRLDLPDADLDFMSTRRGEVVEYLETRWGADRVAGIVNYNTMGAKDSVRSVGRVHGLQPYETDAIKMVPDEHGQSANLTQARAEVPEIEALASQHPLLWSQATVLEGKMRAYGQHAAGVVVAGVDLVERSVVERRSKARVINWDKRVSEDQGLIKLDVLGLSTLDIFDYALKLIWERHGKRIDLNALPLDDDATLRMFSEGRTLGVFQFDGGSVRRLLKEMAKGGTLVFDDLVALNALNRPGPLDAGLVDQYIKRRAGIEPVRYDSPVLEPVLRNTYGVITYQEQVMQTARVLCGFTPGEADVLRKIMGKKDPDAMAKQRKKFVDGAVAVGGMVDTEAARLFDAIEKFAGYAFNKSHSVEYSLISYQACWLKTHYAVEFYCASLSVTSKVEKLPGIVKDANADGIMLLPPDINVSIDNFLPISDAHIMAPFSSILNVSSSAAAAIMAARTSPDPVMVERNNGLRGKKREVWEEAFGPGRFVSIEDVRNRIPPSKLNSRAMENLDKVGAFARIVPGQLPSTHPDRKRDQIALMPGIMDQGVVADRVLPSDEVSTDAMIQVIDDLRTELGPNAVMSHLGSDPRFMVIFDAPFSDWQIFTKTFAFEDYLAPALREAGLHVDHGLWTWVARRPKNKGEKEIPRAEVALSKPFLAREIAICKPPVILTLGNAATKCFFPDAKGLADMVGKVQYHGELDASIIVGFNPMQLYHDPNKAEPLANLFREVKRLVDKTA